MRKAKERELGGHSLKTGNLKPARAYMCVCIHTHTHTHIYICPYLLEGEAKKIELGGTFWTRVIWKGASIYIYSGVCVCIYTHTHTYIAVITYEREMREATERELGGHFLNTGNLKQVRAYMYVCVYRYIHTHIAILCFRKRREAKERELGGHFLKTGNVKKVRAYFHIYRVFRTCRFCY